jgi:ribonuclease HI
MERQCIYTDGSCTSCRGGWAFVHVQKGLCVSGHEDHTTNNRMELTACIKALEWVRSPCIIYTDSQYVKKGITTWIHRWKIRKYRNIKNSDLWKYLDVLNSERDIEWVWVKGHSGVYWNIYVDHQAREAAKTEESTLN